MGGGINWEKGWRGNGRQMRGKGGEMDGEWTRNESFLTVSKKESACGACITSPSPSTGWGRGSGKEENPAPISTV